MAHALLSAVYANTGQSALAPEFSKKAFDLRDRVSDRERFFISWRYYRDAIQAWDKALELARSWTATYPREAFAFNALGNALIRLGQFEQSVEPLREAIRLDPQFVPAYGNLAASLLAVNRLDEARATLKLAADRKLDFIGASRLSYLVAFVQGDTKTMERELEASIGLRQTNSAFGWQAHASAAVGRVKQAHDQYRRGIQMSLHGGFTEVAAQLITEDAEMHATVGQCVEAPQRECPRDFAWGGTTPRSNAQAACSRSAAPAGGREAGERTGKRFPEATLTINLSRAGHRGRGGLQPGRACARRRAARTGQAVRSRAVCGILAPVPSRPGVPSAEERPGRGQRIPIHRRPSGRGARVDAVCSRTSRPRRDRRR